MCGLATKPPDTWAHVSNMGTGGQLNVGIKENDGSNFSTVSSVNPINDGQFHHVAVSFQSAGPMTLYIDGAVVSTNTAPTFNFGPNPLRIGRLVDTFWAPFNGLVDEVEIFNRTLSQAEIQAIFNAGSAGKCKPQCAQPPTGMTAWYPGDGNPNDIQGTNNGTPRNGATFAAGKVGQAFSLDGVDDYVSAPSGPSNSPTNLTIDGWFNLSSTTGADILVSKAAGTAFSNSYNLFLNNGGLHGLVGTVADTGPVVSAPFTPVLGTWYHIAYTFDDATDTQSLYINRQQVATGTTTTTPGYDSNPLIIGAESQNQTIENFFAGLIDEVEIFNRALSQAEIQAIVNAGSAGKCKLSPTPTPTPTTPTPPANDNIQNAQVLTIAPNTESAISTASNVGATRQDGNFRTDLNMPNEPLHDGKQGGRSVWYKWTAPVNGRIVFRTSNNTFDTVLAIYQEVAGSLVGIVSNDDYSPPETRSRVEFLVSQGSVFYIAVDGYGGATGNFRLRWNYTQTQPTQTITQRITRMTDTSSNDIVGVQLGRSGSLEIILRGEGFTAQSQVLVNGDTCLRDDNNGCQPNSSVQTTFRNDATRLEVSIPPIYFTRVGEFRINVRTGTTIAANTGLLHVADFNFVDVQPGQTATVQSNAPVALRPPMRYSLLATNTSSQPLRFTVYQYARDLYAFQEAYQRWIDNGAVGDAPVAPEETLADSSVAVVASPAALAGSLQSLNLQLLPNPSSLIASNGGKLQNSATIIALSRGNFISEQGGALIGNDGSTLVGNDGAGLIGNDGSTLIGNDGSTLVAAGAGNVVSDAGAGIVSNGGSGIAPPSQPNLTLRANGTLTVADPPRTLATDASLRRAGLYVVRDASGGNGNIQVGTDSGGNTTLTADINLTQNTFPRISSLGVATSFSIALDPGLLQFSQATYTVTEGLPFVRIVVRRTGNTSQTARVEYNTTSAASADFQMTTGTATAGRDYEQVFGSLYFNLGETEKSFDVPIINDSYGGVDDGASETFNVVLNNAQGAAVNGTGVAIVTINDNDAQTAPANIVNDAQFFVRQHYLDFLGRAPDSDGFSFWTNQITECSQRSPQTEIDRCVDERRQNVSAAFFLSPEFQDTGYLVYRFYLASFPASTERPRGFPRYLEFMRQTQFVGRGVIANTPGADTLLAQNQREFAENWVQRAEFMVRYPLTLTPAEFVDALYQTAGVTPSSDERAAAIAEYSSAPVTAARARIVRRVAENATLRQGEFRRAFVLMEYLGYLRRSPDAAPDADFGGYDFWLGKLNQFNGDFIRSDMIKSFIVSGEYRSRFGR